MSGFHWERLSWDSDFFGMEVGRLTGGDRLHSESDWRAVQALLASHEARFTYLSCVTPLSPEVCTFAGDALLLADAKTTFWKVIDRTAPFADAIRPAQATDSRDTLIRLAIQSGEWSRFRVDPHLDNALFEAMYRTWMERSLYKQLALEVLVAEVDGTLAGFVTLGDKNGRGDIGIIAVDEPFRGRGLGRMLMHAAERWFADHGYSEMQVVTQGQNKAACALYERNGFHVERVEYLYHIWS